MISLKFLQTVNLGTLQMELISLLEQDSQLAIDWINSNNMIANAGKFQALIVYKSKQDTSGLKLK